MDVNYFRGRMSILRMIDQYPQLRSIEFTDLNIRIFENVSEITSDCDILKYCFAFNFYSKKINNLTFLDKDDQIIRDLSNIIANKSIKNYNSISLLIYFTYIYCVFEEREDISKSEAKYALSLISYLDNEELKNSLVDPLFKLSDPKKYNKITSSLLDGGFNVLSYIKAQNSLNLSLRKTLNKYNMQYEISSRIKSIYSLHDKIKYKNISLGQISDLLGVRLYLDNDRQCFEIMKVIIKEYQVMRDRIKDYISHPKDNGYKSLHITINYSDIPIEIQIRTHKMHEQCTKGLVSHINYKKIRAKS